jgi:16S rRNA (cytidine1402-2'-O)-methyltransferase
MCKMKSNMGTLYIVATPIGNLEDITIRAIKTLLGSDIIACEDTRHTGQLIKHLQEKYPELGSAKPVRYISIRDWNEAQIIPKILGTLSVSDVALVSDAGTPLISDPGFKIVRAARAGGFKVIPIPGPTAAIAAVSAAGLPTNKFLFLGFLAKTWDIPTETTTIIYENPTQLNKTVKKIYERYPTIQIIVAREMTKIYEDFVDGHVTQSPKGEATILAYIPPEPKTTSG